MPFAVYLLIGAVALGVIVWLVYKPKLTREGASAWLRGTPERSRDWWRSTGSPWLERRRGRAPGPVRAPAAPGPPPPVPVAAALRPPSFSPAPAPAPAPVLPAHAGPFPAEWGVVLQSIADFEPEDDAALIAFMQGEMAFQGARAEAWRAQLDHCLHNLGLDPSSVQGIAEYADVTADTAHDAAGMMQRFLTVYQEVREWIANGGTLPHDGRWLTGEGL